MPSASPPVTSAAGDLSSPDPSGARTAGRKRDDSLDPLLLAAAIEVLADVGYERMTITMVADLAGVGRATVYRRWPSKTDLVVQAIRASSRRHVDLDTLPDTGTLRGDLLALFKPHSIAEGERIIKAMAAAAYILAEGDLDPAITSDLAADPWAAAHRRLIARAVMRGEYRQPDDMDFMSQVVPAAVAYRAIVRRQPVDLPFLTAVIDDVLLPAMRNPRAGRSPA